MPRLPIKGDKNGVHEYRITLGTFERERLDSALTAFSINRVATPLVALLSDVTGMTVVVIAFVWFRTPKERRAELSALLKNLDMFSGEPLNIYKLVNMAVDLFQFLASIPESLQDELAGIQQFGGAGLGVGAQLARDLQNLAARGQGSLGEIEGTGGGLGGLTDLIEQIFGTVGTEGNDEAV